MTVESKTPLVRAPSHSLSTEKGERSFALSERQRWYRGTYLRSDHWRELRQRKFAKSPRCQVCNWGRHLDVHHLSYERLGKERLSDLATLCRRCHTVAHNGNIPLPLPKPRATAPLRQKRKRKVRKATAAFCEYAWHCLRMVRLGKALDAERQFLKTNSRAIARLRV